MRRGSGLISLSITLFPELVKVSGNNIEAFLFTAHLVDNCQALLVECINLRLEGSDAAAHFTQLLHDLCRLDQFAPEKRVGTQLAEFFKGVAGLIQQFMLHTLRGQALDFVINAMQIGGQIIQSSANLHRLGA